MRILIDFGHPAHIHYFRNFIRIMKGKGHEFRFVARDKEVLHQLLNHFQLPYKSRGKGGKSLASKFMYIFYADYILLREAIKFKPDLFLSFASPYAAHVSWLMNKPHITLDDTEHAHMAHKLYEHFSNVILSPSCFIKPYSKKQILFNSYMELCYLHPKYFKPDPEIKNELGLLADEKYVVIRFVSWNANHDLGQKGLSYRTKISLVNELSKHARVFISSESVLSPEMKKFQLKIQPSKLHDVIASADLYIGEGSTTASESVVLGTPAIYVNSLTVGYCKEQEDIYGLCFNYRNEELVVSKAIDLITSENLKLLYTKNHQQLLADKIDPTAFLTWFIEKYPDSVTVMKQNPDYQYIFK